jgi:M6 family metalloprotease-like protein
MKKLSIILLLFIVTARVSAVTAFPDPVDFKQPDGDIIVVLIKGDERIHCHESIDGYTLLFNKEGYLTYAVLDEDGNLQPSNFIATNIEKRDIAAVAFLNTIEKKLFYSDMQKKLMRKVWDMEDEIAAIHNSKGVTGVIGEYKTICAFVQFPEKSFVKTMSQFEPLFNQLGYIGNGTGSVRDFFKEASYNKFDLIITLCGFYTAPQSESYYAGSSGAANCQALARWVAQQVANESSINFSEYDSNNDNQVDGFHFIFAGVGQEAGGGSGTIWSHKSQIYPPVTKNGKSISIYSCSPELLGSNITSIGVICHEMSHAFGCADFYDTNYATGGEYTGTGKWDLMADGSWNSNGNRPAHHNPYVKIQYGWITPIVLSAPTTVTDMPNSTENPVMYRINTGTNNEYYLLENRQKVKFDASVPGSGLLIYHVHSSIGYGEINATHPQKMYPVSAGSTVAIPVSGASNYGNINSSGCPFPGSSNNKTSFDGTSTPRMFRWTSTVISDKPLTEITKNTTLKTVSFKFMGGSGNSNNANLASLTVSSGSLTPAFSSNTTNYTVNVDNTVATITITGVAQDPNATVSGNVTNTLITVGNNNFTITVTAQDNTTVKEYYVTVIRADKNQYTITASVENNAGGTISPEGSIKVDEGNNMTFQMIPETDYIIEYVNVDGSNVETSNTYTFNNVTSDHNIIVKFKLLSSIESIEESQIKIYPNPAENYFIIESADIIDDIIIFNSAGQKVLERINVKEKTYKIDIENFTSGIYYLRINNTVEKLIKE